MTYKMCLSAEIQLHSIISKVDIIQDSNVLKNTNKLTLLLSVLFVINLYLVYISTRKAFWGKRWASITIAIFVAS